MGVTLLQRLDLRLDDFVAVAAPLTEVALAASALAELRHGHRNTRVETLKRLLRHE